MSAHAGSSTHGHHAANGGGHGSNGHANGHNNGNNNGHNNAGQGAQGGHSVDPRDYAGWECCHLDPAPGTNTNQATILQAAETADILAAQTVGGLKTCLREFVMSMAEILRRHVVRG